jgi:hypothetical protein
MSSLLSDCNFLLSCYLPNLRTYCSLVLAGNVLSTYKAATKAGAEISGNISTSQSGQHFMATCFHTKVGPYLERKRNGKHRHS